jgi:hypothetical protein
VKTIKRYVNGRFFDMDSKAFIKKDDLAELIRSGEKVTVLQSRTGVNVTREVTRELVPDMRCVQWPSVSIDGLKGLWERNIDGVNRRIRDGIDAVIGGLQLASRDQVSDLSARVAELRRMVADLEKV